MPRVCALGVGRTTYQRFMNTSTLYLCQFTMKISHVAYRTLISTSVKGTRTISIRFSVDFHKIFGKFAYKFQSNVGTCEPLRGNAYHTILAQCACHETKQI